MAQQKFLNPVTLLHTIRYLRPVQIYGRVLPYIRWPRPNSSLAAPPVRRAARAWLKPAVRPRSLLGRWRVRLLNAEGNIDKPEQWNDPVMPKLWLYNLHYFDDLRASEGAEHRTLQREFVTRWIVENTPFAGVGWEPYPVSLRIVNWVCWFLSGEKCKAQWKDSLALQARWLIKNIEWHLLGNHLLANAKALIVAGLFFEGREADGWLQHGLSIYTHELGEQVLTDGAHFELSPMYHAVVLEDLLDLYNLAQAYGREGSEFFSALPAVIADMRLWLAGMTHPDGGPSFFNDSAFGVASTRHELEGYASRLGLPLVAPLEEGAQFFAPSGYVRVNRGDMAAILDLAAIGPTYIPGHGHADTLSFELSLGGERVIVNGGTSTYASGPLREAQRATRAHSTVEMNGENSSEVWASFRVARRAQTSEIHIVRNAANIEVSGEHDGYRRLPGRPSVRRSWMFARQTVAVRDTISPPAAATSAISRFHLGPGVAAEAGAGQRGGCLITRTGRVVRWTTTSAAEIEDTVWYPQFGMGVPAKSLVVPVESGRLCTTFEWS